MKTPTRRLLLTISLLIFYIVKSISGSAVPLALHEPRFQTQLHAYGFTGGVNWVDVHRVFGNMDGYSVCSESPRLSRRLLGLSHAAIAA